MVPRRLLVVFIGAFVAVTTLSAVTPIETLRISFRGRKIKLPLKGGTLTPGNYVPVLAFTKSTTEFAAKVIRERQWIAARVTSERELPWLLVVVRDAKADPLADRFEEMLPLATAAKACDNENGAYVHRYLFVLSADDAAYVKADYSCDEFKAAN